MPTYERLDYGSPDGSQWGGSATDKIAFYGKAPADQYAAALPQATTRTGEIRMYAVAYTTGAHSYSSAAEEDIVVSSVASDSAIYIARSSTTPGIAIAGYRVTSAAMASVTLMNVSTGATVVPVSTQGYRMIEFKANGGFVTTVTWSPSAVAASTTAEQATTVPGVLPGMWVVVNKPTQQTALGIVNARVTAVSTVSVTFANISSAAITPTASQSYTFAYGGTMRPASPVVQYAIPGTTVVDSIAVTSTTEQTTALANMEATDFFAGFTWPATQAGIAFAGGRVNSSGVLGLTFMNSSSGAQTPTSSCMYGVTILRPESRPALWQTTATFPGTTVAASTTVEYTTTCNGLVTSSIVFVNKKFHTPNVGVANVRVSAADTLCVALVNTATTATAVAAGDYVVVASPRAPALGIGAGPYQSATALNSTCAYMSYQVHGGVTDAAAQLRDAFAENGFLPG